MLNAESCTVLLITGSHTQLCMWVSGFQTASDTCFAIETAMTAADAARQCAARSPDCIVVGQVPDQPVLTLVSDLLSQFGQLSFALVLVVDPAAEADARQIFAQTVHEYVGATEARITDLPRSVRRALEKLALQREVAALRHQLAAPPPAAVEKAPAPRQCAREFDTLVANIPELVARFDADLRHQYAAPAGPRAAGLLPEAVVGKTNRELGLPEDVCAVWDRGVAGVLATGQAADIAFGADVAGMAHHFEGRLIPEPDASGAVVAVLAIMTDVTERKQSEADHALAVARAQVVHDEAEALRRLDRLKSEFLANVSHDLRTPLHHIKGFASTLIRPQISFDAATTREYLRIIIEECDTLERLISDLLDTSRLESGKFSLIIDSVDIGELVRKAVRRWQTMSDREFLVDVQGVPPPVPADPRRIQQVLDNLLANVVAHTPPQTSATVSVTMNRNELTVAVQDQGPGISPEHLPHLFDRFYQASSELDRRMRGSGLGLYISKGIVELHGGRMWFEQVPEGGLQFCFSLPRRHRKTKVLGIVG